MLIDAPGQAAGTKASPVSAMVPGASGSWFMYNGILHQLVSVTGATPDAGKVFAHRLAGGVVQIPADAMPEVQYDGTFQSVLRQGSSDASGIAPAGGTIAEVLDGRFFDTGAPDGVLCRRVTVYTAGTPGNPMANPPVAGVEPEAISPGVGNVWQLALAAGAVTAVADTTEVESYGDDAVIMWRLG